MKFYYISEKDERRSLARVRRAGGGEQQLN
jgi:hypothetical protein